MEALAMVSVAPTGLGSTNFNKLFQWKRPRQKENGPALHEIQVFEMAHYCSQRHDLGPL